MNDEFEQVDHVLRTRGERAMSDAERGRLVSDASFEALLEMASEPDECADFVMDLRQEIRGNRVGLAGHEPSERHREIEWLSSTLAHHVASSWPEVQRFRHRYGVGDASVTPDWQPPDDDARSALGLLGKCLAHSFGWSQRIAEEFVVTGRGVPAHAWLHVENRGGWGPISMEIHPEVPATEVVEAYRTAQRSLLGRKARHRPASERLWSALDWSLGADSGTSQWVGEGFNRARPQYAYPSPDQFGQDVRRARARVPWDNWRSPEQLEESGGGVAFERLPMWVTMAHPDLPGQTSRVSREAFEMVWAERGWYLPHDG